MTTTVLIQQPDVCPECGGLGIKTADYVVCRECGRVLCPIYVDSTWSLTRDAQDGPPATQYISFGNSVHIPDALGTVVKTRDPDWHRRLNHHALKRDDDDRLHRALRLLNRLTGSLNIPVSTRDRAAALIRRFLDRINSTTLVEVCLIRACREYGIYLNDKELSVFLPAQFARQFKIRKGRRNRAMFILLQELGPVPISQPINYLSMTIAELENAGIEAEYLTLIQTEARKILTTIKLPGHSIDHHVFAVSCVYYVDKMHEHRLSQKAIGDATKISEYTIRDYYQKYWKKLKEVKERQKL